MWTIVAGGKKRVVASFGEKGGRLFSTRTNHDFPRHDANGEEDGRRRAERSEARCCGRRG